MKKLIIWEIILVVLCTSVYFAGIFRGLIPREACGIVAMAATIFTAATMIAALVGATATFTVSFAATATATFTAVVAILAVTTYAAIAGLVVIAAIITIPISSVSKLKFGLVFWSILFEETIIYLVLRYGYLLLK